MNCSNSSYDAKVFQAALIISLTSSAISVLSNISVVFFIILLKRWSFLNQRLILYLFVATIVGLITDILSLVPSSRRFCIFTAFALQNGAWMTLNAYLCITTSLLIRAFTRVNLEKMDWLVVPAIFASPLLWNWIPFIQHTYGQSGILCWIKLVEEVNGTCEKNNLGRSLQLALWYLPLYLILSFLIIFYVMISVKFCLYKRQWWMTDPNTYNERRNALKYIVSLLAYPMVYFIVNLFPFVDRLHGLFSSATPSPALLLLNTLSYAQQGTGIAIVFFVNMRKKLTPANLKAALKEWTHKTKIEEYEFKTDELEKTVQGSHHLVGQYQTC